MMTGRRVNLSGDPIPGYGEGRPLPASTVPLGAERAALQQAWAACFLDAPESPSAAGDGSGRPSP